MVVPLWAFVVRLLTQGGLFTCCIISIECFNNPLVTHYHAGIGLPCDSFCHFVTKANVCHLYCLSFRSLDSWQQISVRTNQNNLINRPITCINNNIYCHAYINAFLLHA